MQDEIKQKTTIIRHGSSNNTSSRDIKSIAKRDFITSMNILKARRPSFNLFNSQIVRVINNQNVKA